MSIMVVEEYERLAADASAHVIQTPGNLVAMQTVTMTGTSAATPNAVNAITRYIGIIADVDIYFDIAAAPTATTSTRYLAAGCVRYFVVPSGSKVAGIVK